MSSTSPRSPVCSPTIRLEFPDSLYTKGERTTEIHTALDSELKNVKSRHLGTLTLPRTAALKSAACSYIIRYRSSGLYY
eukprot:gene3008-biopygen11795